ncbi:MAG TPA: methyltransferase domain-containing protein [Methanomicrobiales archaeon]|nr:methyltransferase domain-containing protein [Methanomicrobiales archaeon]
MADVWYYLADLIIDLHSKIRYRAIRPYFKICERNIEIGTGTGYISYKFIQDTGKPITALRCKSPNPYYFSRNMTVKSGCLPRTKFRTAAFEQALLIDVLEHIGDDAAALREVNRILEMWGFLLISVPTPYFSKYFGKEFADRVGHVRDGYTLEQLMALLESTGFQVLQYGYHTHALASWCCERAYKFGNHGFFKATLYDICCQYFDEYTSQEESCGLVVQAQKVRNA